MNAGNRLVSVIVPAWNAEATLRETLRSVGRQTHRSIEILIVDDGSTDGTATVAQEFCAAEPRARLIRKQNGGVASARNAGIAEAKGDWVAPIDADDLWHPSKIEKQLAAAVAAPEPPGFVYCWYRKIDEHGDVIASGPRWAFNGRAFERIAYRNPVENGSSLLLSRLAALSVGGYDESLRASAAQGCEDVMIQLRVARDHPIAAVPEYLVGYRVRSDSMSGDTGQMLRSWNLVYQRIAKETPLPRDLMRWHIADVHETIAEEDALAGRYASAIRHYGKALLRDPVRWSTYLAYRLARTAARRIGRAPPPPPIPFSEADPAEFIRGDPHDIDALSRLLKAIDEGRLRRLSPPRDNVAARSAGSPAG